MIAQDVLVQIFNVAFDLMSIIFCALGSVIVLTLRRFSDELIVQFVPLFTCNGLAALCNLLGIVYGGVPTLFGRWILPVTVFGEFFFEVMTSAAFLLYLLYSLDYTSTAIRRRLWLFLPYILFFGTLLFNLIHPSFYYIDAMNVYHRLEWFNFLMLFGIAMLVEDFLLFVYHYRDLSKAKRTAMPFFFILPAVGLVIQMYEYGLYTLLITSTIAIIIMFVMILIEKYDEYVSQEDQMNELKTKVMISQIQPHFIFNCLTAISDLCYGKAPEAEWALTVFARYLRVIIDSLDRQKLTSFKQELEHIRNYLVLEKIRFGDKVRVEYDIQAENFDIPPLTLQPLVENAVKHGITKKNKGGKVKISSYEEGDHFVIKIEDDGIGFDVNHLAEDNRVHVGLVNSRERLQALQAASLKVESTPGVGSKVTITIPRGAKV